MVKHLLLEDSKFVKTSFLIHVPASFLAQIAFLDNFWLAGIRWDADNIFGFWPHVCLVLPSLCGGGPSCMLRLVRFLFPNKVSFHR